MITKATHFSIFVLDQESAYDFYVNKLGFKVNTDAQMGPKGRWLTVNPPEQPDIRGNTPYPSWAGGDYLLAHSITSV